MSLRLPEKGGERMAGRKERAMEGDLQPVLTVLINATLTFKTTDWALVIC